MKQLKLAVAAIFLISPISASAVLITGSQTGPEEWTYDLTYNPFDNYSIDQPVTTITLTGLFGVTGAAGPTSTDFSPSGGFLDLVNLDWSAAVLDGGTTVQWAHIGPGTGNFSIDKNVFGFKIFAIGAVDGIVDLVTDGFALDGTAEDRDITGTVAGPVAPVPEPGTLALLGLGLAGMRFARRKKS